MRGQTIECSYVKHHRVVVEAKEPDHIAQERTRDKLVQAGDRASGQYVQAKGGLEVPGNQLVIDSMKRGFVREVDQGAILS
ncbi:MAG TPA: hypothetical protein VMV12_08415 [Candidatus Micrarchaeaceae archaeon]|nr:hypothetical protein [Candidatus Micrarchaeaceae archaeon]